MAITAFKAGVAGKAGERPRGAVARGLPYPVTLHRTRRRKSIRLAIAAFLLSWAGAASAAETVSGQAVAVDSDVIEVAGRRVMLHGLESVERNQTCRIDGILWECWPAAVRQLEILLSEGPVTCEPVAEPDVYGRLLAHCRLNGKSLNEAFVRSGFAVARADETDAFVAAEKSAEAERIGLWQGEFMRPTDFRTSVGILVDRP